jgi:hypothetical protein
MSDIPFVVKEETFMGRAMVELEYQTVTMTLNGPIPQPMRLRVGCVTTRDPNEYLDPLGLAVYRTIQVAQEALAEVERLLEQVATLQAENADLCEQLTTPEKKR